MATRIIEVPSKKVNFIVRVNATWTHRISITRRDDVPGQVPNLLEQIFNLSSGPGENIKEEKGEFLPPQSLPSITRRYLIIDFKFQKPDGQWAESTLGQITGSINNPPISVEAKDSFPDVDMDALVRITWQ